MFSGGATKADVIRINKETKEKNAKAKQKKGVGCYEIAGQGVGNVEGLTFNESDLQQFAEIVADKMSGEINRLEVKLNESLVKMEELITAITLLEPDITLELVSQLNKMKVDVIEGVMDVLEKSVGRTANNARNGERSDAKTVLKKHGESEVSAGNPHQNQVNVICPEEVGSIISGVLGDLKQVAVDIGAGGVEDVAGLNGNSSEVGDNNVVAPLIVNGMASRDVGAKSIENCLQRLTVNEEDRAIGQPGGRETDVATQIVGDSVGEGDGGILCRKSKRQKIILASLVGDYQCDKRMLHRARESHLFGFGDGQAEIYANKFVKLNEKLKDAQNIRLMGANVASKDFIDVAERTKSLQPKYFSEENIKNVDVDRFYFTFNFDKTHWVGICVDCPSSSIIILDCDIGLRNDNAISKELGPIALLFPYLLKQVGRFQTTKELKAFSVERSKSIPQNGNHVDFAVTDVLLMQAHAIGGLEVC
ncbi:unnamed protein product [Arabis nemorensis]|uniref:Ubiquitin-like protease family profile domain-containing protein n=1 Tax=Arabis nemorensis TaxID=586526 RepID=A0A565CP20_9BRAS|nr:unnamed protein product [Arabis nemorensis]